MPGYTRSRLEMFALVFAALLGGGLIWAFRFRGWYAHDEGLLGQVAERVLMGQIPHRDFDDPYTGGLGLLHALVFRLGGINMNALRDHLALVATIWFAGVFWLLTRWLRPFGAAVVAALIAVLSVPLYPAAMPSWYVLFLSCAAGGVVVTWPSRRVAAAFLAGVLIGIAALAKITAIFAFAGIVWGLVAMRQAEDRERRGAVEVLLGALIFCVLVIRLVSSLSTGRVLFHIGLPPIAVVAGIAILEIRQGRARGFGIDTVLWRRVAALAAGAAVPTLIYVAWLARHDALLPFVASLHAVVGKRAAFASLPPPSVRSILYSIPLLAILFAGGSRFGIRPLFLAAGGFVLGVLAWFYAYIHADFWNALRGLLPAGALLFALAWASDLVAGPLGRIHGAVAPGGPSGQQPTGAGLRALVVFVPLTAMMVLTQFPFAAPIYFLYVLPLLLIAVSAAVTFRPRAAQISAGVLATLYLLFGIVQVIPGSPDSLGMSADHAPDLAWLDLPRGRLLIPTDFADLYRRLVTTMDSVPAGPIWAGPDAPEVAFLSGRVDLNRNFFAILGDAELPVETLAARMYARGAQAIVVDGEPSFSMPLTPAALDSISRYFPRMRTVDRFQVYARQGGR